MTGGGEGGGIVLADGLGLAGIRLGLAELRGLDEGILMGLAEGGMDKGELLGVGLGVLTAYRPGSQ